MDKKQNNTLPIIIMFALFFMIAFVTGLPSPMGVIVAKQFGATAFESQLGFFANFIAYAFMGLPAGLMLKRIGYKKTALTAVVVGFVGVFIQFGSGALGSFPIYLLGAFICGFSVCMLNTVVNPMLNTLGGGGNRGNQLIQFGGVFNSVAATIVPMLVGWLMGAEAGRTIAKANPAMFLAMGIFAVAFIVLLSAKIPEPDLERKAAPETSGEKRYSPLSFRHFVLGAVAIFVYVGIEIGIPSTANLYMTTKNGEQAAELVAAYEAQRADADAFAALQAAEERRLAELVAADDAEALENYASAIIDDDSYAKAQQVQAGEVHPGLGMNAGLAGTITGLYFLLMLVGRLVGGSLGARFSSRAMLLFVSALGLLLVIGAIVSPGSWRATLPEFLGGAQVPLSIVLLVLCGLCTSVMWGGIFNLAVEGLGKYTAAASGIFMVMVCGGGIIPTLQGWVADLCGYIGSYWVIVVCVAYLFYYALLGCRNVNRDIPVE